MRFPLRSKLGIILSLVTILTLVSGFMVMAIASRGLGAHAASSAGVSYKTAHGQVAANPLQLGGQNPAPATSTTVYAAPDHFGTPNAAAQNAPAAAGLSSLKGAATTVLHNFDALSGRDNANVAGILVHPPDQSLCVGHDASTTANPNVEFELINLVIAEYNFN